VVVLVVLGAERLKQEVIRNEPKWRTEVVRNEGHLDIVSPVASVKTGAGRTIASACQDQPKRLDSECCNAREAALRFKSCCGRFAGRRVKEVLSAVAERLLGP
jgi:hypothetical protein